MRSIDNIVLHCTATRQTATVTAIQNHWRNVLGWRNPGYHRLIAADGTIHNLLDYSLVANGVSGHNTRSIHISYIGGVDANNRPIDNRTPQQLRSMTDLIIEAKQLFPNARILGHRDFPNVAKACPSFNVEQWLRCAGLNY
jgi:N-acetylmuramoyl-L-alanine amidase